MVTSASRTKAMRKQGSLPLGKLDELDKRNRTYKSDKEAWTHAPESTLNRSLGDAAARYDSRLKQMAANKLQVAERRHDAIARLEAGQGSLSDHILQQTYEREVNNRLDRQKTSLQDMRRACDRIQEGAALESDASKMEELAKIQAKKDAARLRSKNKEKQELVFRCPRPKCSRLKAFASFLGVQTHYGMHHPGLKPTQPKSNLIY
jgi:hypothetical protein